MVDQHFSVHGLPTKGGATHVLSNVDSGEKVGLTSTFQHMVQKPRGTGQSLAGSVRLERRGGGTQGP